MLDARGGAEIGVARRLEKAPAGVAMWRLVVLGVEIEGRWNVVSGDFRRYDLPPPDLGPHERGPTERSPGHSGIGGSGSTASHRLCAASSYFNARLAW